MPVSLQLLENLRLNAALEMSGTGSSSSNGGSSSSNNSSSSSNNNSSSSSAIGNSSSSGIGGRSRVVAAMTMMVCRVLLGESLVLSPLVSLQV